MIGVTNCSLSRSAQQTAYSSTFHLSLTVKKKRQDLKISHPNFNDLSFLDINESSISSLMAV